MNVALSRRGHRALAAGHGCGRTLHLWRQRVRAARRRGQERPEQARTVPPRGEGGRRGRRQGVQPGAGRLGRRVQHGPRQVRAAGTRGRRQDTGNRVTYGQERLPAKIETLVEAKIKQVACGAEHSLALDEQGRVYSWGFNGYGRLGLKDNKDRAVPTLLPFFSNEPAPKPANANPFFFRGEVKMRAKRISAGSTYSFAIGARASELYFWGITKKSQEATMYPKAYAGMTGWQVRDVCGGTTSVIFSAAAGPEDALVSWGCSPTVGELGYGTPTVASGFGNKKLKPGDIPRSSTHSRKVDDLDGAWVLRVGMGAAHSLAIVRMEGDNSEVGRKCVDGLPVHSPEEVEDHWDPATTAPGGGRGRKKGAASKKRKASRSPAPASSAAGGKKKGRGAKITFFQAIKLAREELGLASNTKAKKEGTEEQVGLYKRAKEIMG